MSGSHPKSQHYVAQGYLERFRSNAGGPRNKAKVFCFDKQTGRCYETSIRNVAQETHFYDVPVYYEGRRYYASIEESLAQWDDTFNRVMGAFLADPSTARLTPQHQAEMAMFIASQYARTREFREEVRQIGASTSEILENPAPTDRDITFMHLRVLPKAAEVIAKLLVVKKWVPFYNPEPIPLWTSDHPVARHNDRPTGPVSNMGFASPGIQVFIPLSPKWVLLLCEPDEHIDPSLVHLLSHDNVLFLNSLQAIGATRFVFSPDDRFDLVRRVIARNPDLARPDRPRILMNSPPMGWGRR